MDTPEQHGSNGAVVRTEPEEESRPSSPGPGALEEMQLRLVRQFLAIVTVSCAAITARELYRASNALPGIVMTAIALAALILSYRARPSRMMVLAVLLALVVTFIRASLGGRGGASASALALAFFPGLLGILLLGPRLGWIVCGAMLLGFAWLRSITDLKGVLDQLRFSNEVALTLFAAGLAHTLHGSFSAYERVIRARKDALARLHEERRNLTVTIYDELEPASRALVQAASDPAKGQSELTASFQQALDRLIKSLQRAKVLATHEDDRSPLSDPDAGIRTGAIAIWLRLAALLMAFFAARNALVGAPFVAPIVSASFCVVTELWLRSPKASRHLEATAFSIGLLALGPLIAQVRAYGATPSAPALVITPGAVLLVVVLSRGPAAFAAITLNALILLWVGVAQPLSLLEERLLTNLLLSFVVIFLVIRRVLSLRTHYTRTLLGQERSLRAELAQHRRLAGTLFHDASNNLQSLALTQGGAPSSASVTRLRSLSQRVERLIHLSKHFLLDPSREPRLTPYSLGEAFSLVHEAFGPHLEAKRIRLSIESSFDQPESDGPVALAEPELLVESVLGNLVSNAIKFSPEGTVIAVSADAIGDEVRVRIRDSGPGFPPGLLEQFTREGSLPTTRGTAGERGQGFGLKLAREHVERMGGSLELLSASSGTECVVRLRRAQNTNAPMPS